MLDTSKKLKKVVYNGVGFPIESKASVQMEKLEDGSYALTVITK